MIDYVLLVFDWDGILVDLIVCIVDLMKVVVWEIVLLEWDDIWIKGIIGFGLFEVIVLFYLEVGDFVLVECFWCVYSEYYLVQEVQLLWLFFGVVEVMVYFCEVGFCLVVVIGKSWCGLDWVLVGYGWSDFFDIICCVDEMVSKLDLLMFYEILVYCWVELGWVLMIGDLLFDLEMV